MDETPIDFTLSIDSDGYTTNDEYRQIMRKIFRMKPQYRIDGNTVIFNDGMVVERADIDDETLDEMNLDESRFDICFKYILEMTKNMPKLMELYEISSSKFMKIDVELGIANLLSFYAMPSYYSVLCKIHKGELLQDADIENIKQYVKKDAMAVDSSSDEGEDAAAA